MKKLLTAFLLICILMCLFPGAVQAAGDRDSKETNIEFFEDGSYIITVIETNRTLLVPLSNITKTKTEYYYDSNHNLDWKASLTASFTYNGTTSSCTNASIGYHIYDSDWRLTSSNCSKSGATATGNFTFKHYVLLIPNKTINKTLTLTCDKNGNVT